MATVLYVTANPKPESESVCLRMGREFLRTYELTNPLDEIVELDLYRDPIPLLDFDVFSGWSKLNEGSPLTLEERKKLGRISELVEQFIHADKYIFVTPMWNFGLPPMFKAYIDLVCMQGKTYQYTAAGPVGMLLNKKAVHIQARGQIYSQGPAQAMEYADSYVRLVLGLMGITDVQSIIAEGTSDPQRFSQILQQGIQLAKQQAVQFAQS
ncbi:FMN-dependent NADH-azoreductase [Laceyella sacchari]|uniref:FMN dependent NADH:quinone oxidoreductase n=3 Tax=Laceyella TaxID=292635 RepID=A0AA45WQX9_9BACL|nr:MULTISPECIES: FMN-dependent NADH-azoreductase [Laceyella]KPC77786.1 FMN-dependent NADH-azoreductase [Thermoactinomyces vulgaris]AUS08475.1 FMN-dependent NADH-azoreductase [Laceyella sacchari]MRG26740.1 FMN-dependent NADH-azoreductase [Laceyella tengchongensis]PRZ15783.1 FMN-dependent NADH-azoreductase [Laceyella sediminis]TCW41138.1 FMN-dependent NADH-azoreductase [Laceyella sacchari]